MSEKLTEAINHLKRANEILNDVYDDILGLGKEEPKKKLSIEINVKKPFGEEIDLNDEELEQIRKDLEEIMNDITRK